SHLLPCLLSCWVRWRYGAMAGRDGDPWSRRVASLEPAPLVQPLLDAGFSGIYLDRAGYPDHATGLETELERLLDPEPLISSDQKRVFFPLRRDGLAKSHAEPKRGE